MSHHKKRTVPEHALSERHENHDEHLCHLVSHRLMSRAAELSKDAQFICNICGRAAAKAENLCEAVEI